jgi:hypothetical protein
MILELIIMKLMLDAIMQQCRNLAPEQDLREHARLLKLMNDYEAGAIDQKTYSEQEAEIMASLAS